MQTQNLFYKQGLTSGNIDDDDSIFAMTQKFPVNQIPCCLIEHTAEENDVRIWCKFSQLIPTAKKHLSIELNK